MRPRKYSKEQRERLHIASTTLALWGWYPVIVATSYVRCRGVALRGQSNGCDLVWTGPGGALRWRNASTLASWPAGSRIISAVHWPAPDDLEMIYAHIQLSRA